MVRWLFFSQLPLCPSGRRFSVLLVLGEGLEGALEALGGRRPPAGRSTAVVAGGLSR